MTLVRNATLEDASRILEIYDYYVKHTAISFEYETPSLEEFKGRMKRTMSKYPYLVILKEDKIFGYAYAGSFVGRAAYSYSCEMTIYLDKDAKGCGLGRMLYETLERVLKAMGFTNLYACIGHTEIEDEYLTNNSEEFHAHLGYKTVGMFHNSGYKFNRWYDMIWMEKIVGKYEEHQKPIIYYPDLKIEL